MRPSCTTRVRPPDCRRIQRVTGAVRRPEAITSSGQGGRRSRAFPRRRPRRLSPRIALGSSAGQENSSATRS